MFVVRLYVVLFVLVIKLLRLLNGIVVIIGLKIFLWVIVIEWLIFVKIVGFMK